MRLEAKLMLFAESETMFLRFQHVLKVSNGGKAGLSATRCIQQTRLGFGSSTIRLQEPSLVQNLVQLCATGTPKIPVCSSLLR